MDIYIGTDVGNSDNYLYYHHTCIFHVETCQNLVHLLHCYELVTWYGKYEYNLNHLP